MVSANASVGKGATNNRTTCDVIECFDVGCAIFPLAVEEAMAVIQSRTYASLWRTL